MSDPYRPSREDRFSFGLWTVGNRGRDPFGEPVRPPLEPVRIVERLASLGAWGVNLHDDDLVPPGSGAADRDRIVRDFKKALADHGLRVPMATANLFSHPAFKDGAFTANDPRVRAAALQKTLSAIDLGVELGAEVHVFWGGREGCEVEAARDPREAIRRYREAVNFLCEYALDGGARLRFALEAKPNEPRGDLYFPTTGHFLHFITTLDHPEMVGVNPEVAHEQMAGLHFPHAVAQALEAGKLFHIDLNGQKPTRFDQDLRFGAEDQKGAFYLVKLLEEGGYTGPRHFDAHALRTEDEEGVWAFALGCMRTYKMLEEKVRRFRADPEIQGLLREVADDGSQRDVLGPYSREKAGLLRGRAFDLPALGARGLRLEALDQLVTELLLGAR